MRSVNGGLVIVIGFLLLYIAVTGKMDCLASCWSCLTGAGAATGGAGAPAPSTVAK